MLDRSPHEINLKRILRDLYADPVLAAQLVFKGGTCLYLFHELDRFSVDLDFSLRGEDLDEGRITAIVDNYLQVKQSSNKYHTYFWLGSFEKGKQKIKIEVSKRDYPDTYEIKDFFGLSVCCLDQASLFAHKLCAVTDRAELYSRDLYDCWFMFKHNFPINAAIISERMGKAVSEYLADVKIYIEKNVNPAGIMEGLVNYWMTSKKSGCAITSWTS